MTHMVNMNNEQLTVYILDAPPFPTPSMIIHIFNLLIVKIGIVIGPITCLFGEMALCH